jgi:hypothetical protein|tara:strand:- start:320 stop:475 length:156 start_codon:yes stop_codon:yes gene_type:complete
MTKKNKPTSKSNPVKKNMDKLHKPATHKDKKREAKINGYSTDKAWIDENES